MYFARFSSSSERTDQCQGHSVWRDRNVKYYFSRGTRMNGDGIGNKKKKKAF